DPDAAVVRAAHLEVGLEGVGRFESVGVEDGAGFLELGQRLTVLARRFGDEHRDRARRVLVGRDGRRLRRRILAYEDRGEEERELQQGTQHDGSIEAILGTTYGTGQGLASRARAASR